jgi:hypothetical protein
MPALKTEAIYKTAPVSNRHHAAHQARLIVCIEIRKDFIPTPMGRGIRPFDQGKPRFLKLAPDFPKR